MTKEFNGVTLDCYKAENEDDGFFATREQIGRLLEYAEPMKAVAKIHERNHNRLDKFSTIVNLTTVEGDRTVTRDVFYIPFIKEADEDYITVVNAGQKARQFDF